MGTNSSAEIDAQLRDGGLVVAASDRAARAVTSGFHRARRDEGLTAWSAPQVFPWQRFLREAWHNLTIDGRLILNSTQEQSLWAEIVAQSGHSAVLLEGPRQRLSAMAMEAHQLLCSHASRFLHAPARSGWQQDCDAFSQWLITFQQTCIESNCISINQLPLELNVLLRSDRASRPPLLLAGFDRLLPFQREIFDAWGNWRQVTEPHTARQMTSWSVPEFKSELAACAQWCKLKLASDPQARLLVVTQDTARRRGEIERAFLRPAGPAPSPRFEFSLGVPLLQTSLARSALLLLRWLAVSPQDGSLDEQDVDWLLSSGHAAANPQQTAALQAYMRALRRRGLERPRWTLSAFLRQSAAVLLPSTWVRQLTQAQRKLSATSPSPQSPLDWAGLVPQLLDAAGWSGFRPASSSEFQIAARWQQVVETCGSLGFDGRRVHWSEFLSELERELNETLFATESEEAPILIAGPAESAGLTADAIWFLGADEDTWPARGPAHPLLPIDVQREAAMPHASPQLDWDLARTITARLASTAPEIHFSHARLKDGVETRPSRLVAHVAGPPQPLPSELAPTPLKPPLAVPFADFSRIPLPPAPGSAQSQTPSYIARGGSAVLSHQSQCPFKAFATARLGAQNWDQAQTGLTASIRGQLLHAVMHAVWAGPPNGIRTLDELKAIPDTIAFVGTHVRNALESKVPPGIREQVPPRYLELEEQRLTQLIVQWLEYEMTRLPFTVAATEVDAAPVIAGLTLKLRLDRVDRLSDGTLLVVDYKTGNVSEQSWNLPRPNDVQLPLYAGFGLPDGELGGLVFAKVRPGKLSVAGRVGRASSTLFAGLKPGSALVKNPLSAEQLINWRYYIEQLARDFIDGRAEVDPREYPNTCERCGLQTLCRIQEREAAPADEAPIAEGSDE